MVKILIFSKDRNLQLTSLLNQISYYFTKDLSIVSVITPDYQKIRPVHTKFNYDFEVWSEDDYGSFDLTFREWIKDQSEQDIILFMVDDCVIFRQLNLDILEEVNLYPNTSSFSLRMGTNINFCKNIHNLTFDPRFILWAIPKSISHWGYAGSISSDAYNCKFLKEMISANPKPYVIPNSIESWFNHYINNSPNKLSICLNMESICGAADINRAQCLYENPFNGTQETTIENLQKRFEEGWAICWQEYFNMKPKDPFIGTERFKIKGPMKVN